MHDDFLQWARATFEFCHDANEAILAEYADEDEAQLEYLFQMVLHCPFAVVNASHGERLAGLLGCEFSPQLFMFVFGKYFKWRRSRETPAPDDHTYTIKTKWWNDVALHTPNLKARLVSIGATITPLRWEGDYEVMRVTTKLSKTDLKTVASLAGCTVVFLKDAAPDDRALKMISAVFGWAISDLREEAFLDRVDEWWSAELGKPGFTPRRAIEEVSSIFEVAGWGRVLSSHPPDLLGDLLDRAIKRGSLVDGGGKPLSWSDLKPSAEPDTGSVRDVFSTPHVGDDEA